VITVLLLGTTTAKYSQTFNDVVQHGLCWWFSSFALFSFLFEVVGYIIKELHLRLLYFEYIFSLHDHFSHAGVLPASQDPLHCSQCDVDIESSRPGRSAMEETDTPPLCISR
jgi:hypothetical protein